MKKQKSALSNSRLTTGVILGVGISVLSACSDSETTSTETVPNDDGVPEAPSMIPVDTDNDDRPGLIVTGLNGMDAEDLTSPWLVNTLIFRRDSFTPGTGDGFVHLVQYQDDFPVSRHIDFYARQLDTCEINDPNARQPIGGGGDGGGTPPPRISGGATVVINTPSGPWFTYDRLVDDVEGDIYYNTDNQLPGVLPEGATLSIPGDAFPTLSALPLYEPDAPVRLLPDETLWVASDSDFSWVPGNSVEYIELNLLAYSGPDNDFEGFYVNCYLEDDGAFTMPGSVVDYIATTEFNLDSRYSRVYDRIDLVNGIVAHQRVVVAE